MDAVLLRKTQPLLSECTVVCHYPLFTVSKPVLNHVTALLPRSICINISTQISGDTGSNMLQTSKRMTYMPSFHPEILSLDFLFLSRGGVGEGSIKLLWHGPLDHLSA